MATLQQATQPLPPGHYEPFHPTQPPTSPAKPPIAPNPDPTLNVFLRCPIPPFLTSGDSLRQYYRGGLIPQTRIFGNVKILGT